MMNSFDLESAAFADNPYNNALRQAELWEEAKPEAAQLLKKIGSVPTAYWLTGHTDDVRTAVASYAEAASQQDKLPVTALYNIPERDKGEHSAGGVDGAVAYDAWIGSVAEGLGDRPALVILEPDSLAQADRFTPEEQAGRYQMLARAVTVLATQTQARVYLDAGHPGWHPAPVMAGRLERAGIERASGFSLNVSNFQTTADNVRYGHELSSLLGGKHFTIDTSRNGNGPSPDSAWCNPSGRALGELPALNPAPGEPLLDAYLWVKIPGESDGAEGQPIDGTLPPAAGSWWPEYALQLAKNAGW
ncbi:MAG TPA: glycoside hydrolase family 6 protein [Candidatus Saccharimonadales bacterium]|nr:glycoside hydrolase family 6 protein [Candidatus Saccharimonadales bacterium]